MGSTTALPGSHAERGRYLEQVIAAPDGAKELAGLVVGLPELYRNLAILDVAQRAPGLLRRAYDAIEQLGCLACPHGRHRPGECAVPVGEAQYCVCGVE